MSMSDAEALVVIAQTVLRNRGADKITPSMTEISQCVIQCAPLIPGARDLSQIIAEIGRRYGHLHRNAPIASRLPVVLNTGDYLKAHGHRPRLTQSGSWAFFFERTDDVDKAFWFNGPLSEAVRAAKAEARKRGVGKIYLGS